MLGRAVCATVLVLAVAAPAVPPVRIYDADPTHLWNRLHAAMFVRTSADGRVYGLDRVDPLLWRSSRYLLTGPAHDALAGALDEFLRKRGERLTTDPVKHALLQRDLWTVFDWFERNGRSGASRSSDDLRGPLATAIARLALTPEQVRDLGDNYPAAAAAGLVPDDLFAEGGPWVSVGRPDGPVAARHVRDDGPGRNSVFFVFIRLPGGRAATTEFVERLRTFRGPLWASSYPSPEVPQFPVGTKVVLVRRALLIDSHGNLAPSPLTEQVQLRTYTDIQPMTQREFEDAMRIDQQMFGRAGQTFDEYSLSRQALLAGLAGGLRSIDDEPFFLTFGSHGLDPFDERAATAGADGQAARRLCKDCHAPPGVYSFNSYLEFRVLRPSMPAAHAPARLSPVSVAESERTAMAWKSGQPEWRALRTLWPR